MVSLLHVFVGALVCLAWAGKYLIARKLATRWALNYPDSPRVQKVAHTIREGVLGVGLIVILIVAAVIFFDAVGRLALGPWGI